MRLSSKKGTQSARRLRRDMTFPEVLLWQQLRQRPGGRKFRRQHPVGPYVLDFYCDEAGVAVEVDGMAHDMGDRPRRDEERDAWLRGRGVHVLRIAARDVLDELEAVVRMIVELCSRRPLHHSLQGGIS